MSTIDVIAETSKPTFYGRVAFLALKVAQAVATEPANTTNHLNRTAYADRIFRGEDMAILIAQHVVSSNPTIYATIQSAGGDAVPDNDIEFALSSIWNARANAYAATGAMAVR